jgi:membrane-associated phospholipid phosphatase
MFTFLRLRPASQTRRAAAQRKGPPCLEPLEDRCLLSANVVLEWNQLALSVIRQTRPNPLLAARDLAIMQVAVYDSVNAIDGSFTPYFAHVHASPGASLAAAAAQAAHDTLTALFPAQVSTFDTTLATDLVGIPPGQAGQGSAVGHDVAGQILNSRSSDGSSAVVPYTPGTNPGDWQPTPPAFLPALSPQWALVTPFAMTSGSQFRPPPPPALTSTAYATAFNEVKSLGRIDSTTRTADQTQIALFWKDAAGTAYAFGHWNEIAEGVSVDQGLGIVDDARLFALLNIATADALIACWDAKYTYNFWRPITAIQFAGDSAINPATTSDPTWTPLIVTPNFPSYMSAHSTVSGAAAAVLTALFGPDYSFTAGSDGLPGVTRSFTSFTAAAEEAGQSRIYGGIHYQFDNQAGLATGGALAQFVFQGFLGPIDTGDAQQDVSAGRRRVLAARHEAIDSVTPGRVLGEPLAAPAATDQVAVAPVGKDDPIRPASPLSLLLARAAKRRVLDAVFADLEGSIRSDALGGEAIRAWTV